MSVHVPWMPSLLKRMKELYNKPNAKTIAEALPEVGSGGEVTAAAVASAIGDMNTTQAAETRTNIGAASAAEQAQLITRVTNVEGIRVPKGVTTDTLTPAINHNYVYMNPLTSLTITNPPATGAYSIVFTSGATATTTTIPATILGLEDFSAEANTVYEINVLDNRAVVGSWAVTV